jgi:hypothetical protein
MCERRLHAVMKSLSREERQRSGIAVANIGDDVLARLP